MTFTCSGQATIESNLECLDSIEYTGSIEVGDEDLGGSHGPHGMRAGRADSDGEEIEGTDDGMLKMRLVVGVGWVGMVDG